MNIEERLKVVEEKLDKLLKQQYDSTKEEPITNTRYWEFIRDKRNDFTKGKIYKLIDGKNINDTYAFKDDKNSRNGYYPDNLEYFKPSTEEAYLQQIQVNECVHITTNDEYLFFISKFNPNKFNHIKLGESLFEYNKNICIYTIDIDTYNIGKWDYLSDIKENTKILSFSEWCKKYNYEEPKWNQGFIVGDYSEKPLILEVSNDHLFKDKYVSLVYKITINSFESRANTYLYARKIDLDKYQI